MFVQGKAGNKVFGAGRAVEAAARWGVFVERGSVLWKGEEAEVERRWWLEASRAPAARSLASKKTHLAVVPTGPVRTPSTSVVTTVTWDRTSSQTCVE